ncbi:MAG: hypothetical protein M3N10_07810 [Actinomycetota bacterium]|nr:hypothetical protein [Actinomycetota bacterium]HZY65936.1 hypothetical protein [Rubrobacteraceae bacterium]
MSEEVQKRMITILSGIIAYAIADRLADRFLNVPDEPGISDDIKEALIKGGFRFASTALASIIVRQIVSRYWGS